ncbi:apolipoprotein C-II-like isoform X2 [Crotalus tigris]|uniref:apolipoprotein C-II-like isoform X2 n=1 Tax=Crotalus tigris TaxID=88082 RepID=UPI00192F4BCC|nr:apolipoprotein C-II-like isoform X2 [Crotalus tigris]
MCSLREGTALAKMNLKLTVASILLLLLCSEVLSYSVQKRNAEDKTVLSQIQDAARGYYDYISDVTNSWVEKVKSYDISQRLWSNYKNLVETVNTYQSILTDQVEHWWQD